MVAAVRDDPARRLGLASRFYDDRPGCVSIRSYRRAEMAFMRWQVRRGLLAAPDAPRPGSEWWRAVNEGLLRDAWEADQLLAGRPGPASRPSVSRWSGFLERPSAVTWYRAHNASIVAGYLEHEELCAAELPVERFFMNVRPEPGALRARAGRQPEARAGPGARRQPGARRSALAGRRRVPVAAQHPAGQVSARRLHPERDPGAGELRRPPDRLRRDAAPGPGAVRLRGGGSRTSPGCSASSRTACPPTRGPTTRITRGRPAGAPGSGRSCAG